MRERPKSRWQNEDGSFNFQGIGVVPEFPEVIAWDKDFANECDRLAELDAIKTGKRHFGRWYLTKTALVTKTIRPEIDGQNRLYVGVYEIGLDRARETPGGRGWVKHIGEKNWIGEKGLRDLADALDALRREVLTKAI